jgi:hypothetical protein
MDIYFFKDGGGNFAPANYRIEYLSSDNTWHVVKNADGLGVAIDQYNKTIFDAVVTTALRVTMTPASLGCGVIEWKVYGYMEGSPLDKTTLNAAITHAEGLDSDLFTAGMDAVDTALAAAKDILASSDEVTQDDYRSGSA